jgi:hypothetical protein
MLLKLAKNVEDALNIRYMLRSARGCPQQLRHRVIRMARLKFSK